MASIQNSAEVLGVHVQIDDIKLVAGTTYRNGTSSRGLYRAIRSVGLKPYRYYTNRHELAWRWLLRWSSQRPIIIFLGSQDHYVTVTGRIRNEVVVVDSYPKLKKNQNGTNVFKKSDLMPEWSYRGLYWGIRVSH